MPYQKISDETLQRCEAYLKSQHKSRSGRGNKDREYYREVTFDEFVQQLLKEVGF